MKVIVFGAGIVGLWTADVLSLRGHDVVVRHRGSLEDTTSAAAVAVITPLFPGNRDDPSFQRSIHWYQQTLNHVLSLEDGRFIEWIPAYEFGITVNGQRYLEKDFEVGKFADVGLDVAYVDVIPAASVANHVDEVHEITFGARINTPLCNSQVFLPWIASRLRGRGVRFDARPAESIASLHADPADVYINCMGFDSLNLFPDDRVWGVRGQSMFIPVTNNPAPHFGIAAGNHAIFKHQHGYYVGSYFLEDEADPRALPSEVEYRLSRDFALTAYPLLCETTGFGAQHLDLAQATRVNSGIRPFRRGGPRIATEVIEGLRVVHHYGHGAHGWTIGYGTALEVASLVEDEN